MPFVRRSLEILLERTELSAYELAPLLAVSKSTVYRWLAGDIDPIVRSLDALYHFARQRGFTDLTFYVPPPKTKDM